MTKSRLLLAVAAALLAVLIMVGRSLPAASLAGSADLARATSTLAPFTATPTPLLSLAPVVREAPTPTSSPVAVAPAAAVKASLTTGEAERVVRDFFAAVEAKDYARLRELTSGQARQAADGLVGQAQQAERDNHVTLTLHASKLDVLDSQPRGDGAAVKVDFAIDVEAQAGFMSVPVRSTAGEAEFTVANVDGRATITDIAGSLY
jgi:hypothetical protein